MSEHTHCLKEGDLATIKAEVSDLKKIVKGNGQKGLQQIVTELNLNVPQLTNSVSILSGQVQELLDRKVASDTERNLKLSARQKLVAIYGAIIGAATVIVMIAQMIVEKK
jgi:ribosomal protein L3